MPASPCGGGQQGMGMPMGGQQPMGGMGMGAPMMGGKPPIEGKGGPGGPMPLNPLGPTPNPYGTNNPYGMGMNRFGMNPTFGYGHQTTNRYNRHQPTASNNRLNQGLNVPPKMQDTPPELNQPDLGSPAASPAATPDAPMPGAAPPPPQTVDDSSIGAAPQTADPAVPADLPLTKKLKKTAKKVKKSKTKKHH